MENAHLTRQDIAQTVIRAAGNVLHDIVNYRPKEGQIQITPAQFTRDDVTVVSRFSGDVTGQILFGFTVESARSLGAQMLQAPPDKLGTLELSALTELGSIITDASLALLEDNGAICYPVWSSLVLGQDERLSPVNLPALEIPLHMIVGDMHLNLVVEAQAPFAWSGAAQRQRSVSTVIIPGRDAGLAIAA
ncbi:MAG: chemotaxis protein CheX [Armatimonadetes bacterium]|nr:chemotaxis protein CheX [Armatimonadota bacterium]